jgi:hypothetical protein
VSGRSRTAVAAIVVVVALTLALLPVGERVAAGRLPEAGAAGRAAYWVGLAATAAAAVVVARAARRALDRSLAAQEGGTGAPRLTGTNGRAI